MGELAAGTWRRNGIESVLAGGELRCPPCGFATTQAAYEAAVGEVFETLDWSSVWRGTATSSERIELAMKLMADHGFSERRACRLIGVNRSAWQYEPLRGKDEAVRVRMREIANERRRFGYRRLAIMLRREGKGMNLKKVYRLYREERLTVRKRGGRKRALGTRAPMAV